MELIKTRAKQFKRLVSLNKYKHLKKLEGYACMPFKYLVNLEGKLNYNLSNNIGDNIRNAVEYAKITYCKYLQDFEFDPYPFTYSDNIEPDIDGLYRKLSLQDYEILLKNFKDLEEYEKNNKPIDLKNNIFLR